MMQMGMTKQEQHKSVRREVSVEKDSQIQMNNVKRSVSKDNKKKNFSSKNVERAERLINQPMAPEIFK